MPAEPGRRERKKQQTKQALVEAAVRLFNERGYEGTSVSDIAEAADVSKRTFFLHFPAKEDVLLTDGRARLDLALRTIEGREPDAPMREVLSGAMRAMIADTAARDLPGGVAALRAKLIVDSPAVRARVLHAVFTAQTGIAESLRRAYPDELDAVTASSVVGAMVGAISAAAIASLRNGDGPEQSAEAMHRAAQIALSGIDAVGTER